MKPCLRSIMNCPAGIYVFLQAPQIVQIIGIKPFKSQINFIVSDGTFFSSSFMIPRTDNFKLFQLIEFKKFRIHIHDSGIPILIIHPSKIISQQKDCIGQPTQLNEFSNIPSLHLQKCDYPEELTPIKELNIYQRFTILARVISKCQNTEKPTIMLQDRNNDKINGVFQKDAYQIFSEKVQLNRIYLISNASYSKDEKCKKLIFTKSSIFNEMEDDFSISIQFQPLKINEIDQKDKESMIDDLKAIIVDIGSIQRSKDDGFNRILLLSDDSNATIQMKLYDSYALSIQESDEGHVVIIKSAMIKKKFGRMYVYINGNSYLKILDDSHELARDLVEWYQSIEGAVGNFRHLSNKRKVKLDQIRREDLGKTHPEYFIVEAKLRRILVCGVFYSFHNEKLGIESNYTPKTNRSENFTLYYDTCPFDCKRKYKKLQFKDGKYFCPECGKFIENPKVLYQFDTLFVDENGYEEVFRVKTFNQGIGELILGMKAKKWKSDTQNLSKKEKEELIKDSLINYRLEVSASPDIEGKRKYPILTIEKIFPLFNYND